MRNLSIVGTREQNGDFDDSAFRRFSGDATLDAEDKLIKEFSVHSLTTPEQRSELLEAE